MKVYHANVPVLPSAEIQNSKHKFGHDEALPAPTTGGWTAGAVVMEIQTDLNSKKNKQVIADPSSTIFMKFGFPLHKFSFFPLQDTNVTCLRVQKSKILIKTNKKCKCEG